MKRWMGWLSMFQTALLMISHKAIFFLCNIIKGQKAVAGLETTTGRGDLELKHLITQLIKQMILHLSSTCVRFDGTDCKLII
jgi:hypothetical protein